MEETSRMPEGIEWPRYESGELVGFGDEYVNAKGNVSTLRTIAIKDCRDRLGWDYYWKLGKGVCAVVVKNGERIKRPADLIEPSTKCPYHHSNRHYCSAYDDVVDRDALLDIADEMERRAGLPDVTLSGQDFVFSKFLLCYAERIREALGVES